ncbi:MAG: cupin [Bacteroidota bacterium]
MKRASIYHDLKFDSHKPLIDVLFETEFTIELRVAMQEGTELEERMTKHPIVVEMFEGHIELGAEEEVSSMDRGDLVTLSANVPHKMIATEKSIVRLTLSKN